MLILKTDKGVYRYCSYCKAPMQINKETDEILSARCPEWTGHPGEQHDTKLEYATIEVYYQYLIELFSQDREEHRK